MPIEFIRARASEIQQLSRDKTFFLFPVGPLEDHGPHLPLGTDLFEAEAFAKQLAARIERDHSAWKCVLMPAAPLGVDANTSQLAVTVRAHVLRDWLVDGAKSLVNAGFQYFGCVSGNLGPRQLTAIEEAGRMLRRPIQAFARRKPIHLLSLSSAWIDKKKVLESPIWPDPREHAGRTDTSLGLALFPEQVGLEYEALPSLTRPGSHFSRWFTWLKNRTAGYWGNPSAASDQEGQSLLHQRIEKILPKLSSILEGGRARSLFRSWYSVFPPNWSFFKAWALLLLIMLLMIAWVYLSLTTFFL